MNEKQKIARDAFIQGVDWTLAQLIKCDDIFDFTKLDADVFHQKAVRLMEKSSS